MQNSTAGSVYLEPIALLTNDRIPSAAARLPALAVILHRDQHNHNLRGRLAAETATWRVRNAPLRDREGSGMSRPCLEATILASSSTSAAWYGAAALHACADPVAPGRSHLLALVECIRIRPCNRAMISRCRHCRAIHARTRAPAVRTGPRCPTRRQPPSKRGSARATRDARGGANGALVCATGAASSIGTAAAASTISPFIQRSAVASPGRTRTARAMSTT